MTIFELLRSDHRKVSSLIARLKDLGDGGREGYSLFEKLKDEIEAHSRAEEQAVYESLKSKNETEELVSNFIEEHSEVDQLLEEMSYMDPDDEEFQGRLSALNDRIDHHVRQEETQLFEKMKTLLSKKELEQMELDMEAYKLEQKDVTHRPEDAYIRH